jgi:hypothetical protein
LGSIIQVIGSTATLTAVPSPISATSKMRSCKKLEDQVASGQLARLGLPSWTHGVKAAEAIAAAAGDI